MKNLKHLYESQISATGEKLKKAIKNDIALKNEIAQLAKDYLGKKVAGCGNCYADAYIELIVLYKKYLKDKEMTKFKVKAGSVIRDPKGASQLTLTMNNVSDALAIYHLANNPESEKFFTKIDDSFTLSNFKGKTWEQIKEDLEKKPAAKTDREPKDSSETVKPSKDNK